MAGLKNLMRNVKPYKSGYLHVGNGHELYYEACGNPKGLPTLFIHGGPGAGFSDHDKSCFDFKRQNVIFFDQRGAGRSRPFASIHDNTTWHLVNDIEFIRQTFNIEKLFLFGGSWGSTLALAYAVNYPKRVSGMLLRGIFLSTDAELIHYIGGGTRQYFPESWERFISQVPMKNRKQVARYYLKQMKSKNIRHRNKFAYEWAFYEISLAKLFLPAEEVKKFMKQFSYRSLAVLEAHYIANRCFFSKDYFKKRVHVLKPIPLSIVNGRYDVLTPPDVAYDLHKALPKSKLQFVCSGHSATDEALGKALKSEMYRMVGKS